MRSHARHRILPLAIAILAAAHLVAQQADPDRFEPEIRKYELADRASPPAPGSIIFIVSSTIRRWETLPKDFPGAPVVNRGFGGSEASDVVRYARRMVVKYQPSRVVFYAGDNDLARGKTPAQIVADVERLWQIIGQEVPGVRMAIVSVKPSLARWALVEKTRETNTLLRRFADSDTRLTYVDVFTPMIGADGKPIPSHFVEDGLHLTPEGYRVWTQALAPFVR